MNIQIRRLIEDILGCVLIVGLTLISHVMW